MIERHLLPHLLTALADRPVVLLTGARQVGKSTLAQWIAARHHPARYITLDELAVLAAARQDPAGFVRRLPGSVVLDEVQRVPELFVAIKAEVDRDRRLGRFLLTGSANVLLLPRLAESLVGRMEILTLWPLSQGEYESSWEGFADAVFTDTLPAWTPEPRPRRDLVAIILRGGYPELQDRPADRRRAWFDAYVTTLLQRDVRDLANVAGLTEFPRLLALLATRAGALLNYADIARSLQMSQTTLKRYMSLLEMMFLVQTLTPWFSNIGLRLAKTPKLLLSDSGLMAHLLGYTEERLDSDAQLFGPLLENFVAMELRKQIAWSRTRPQLFHYRTHTQQEVDIVLEDPLGRLVGIEVKATESPGPRDFKGLRDFAAAVGARFHRGVLLYSGTEVLPFGPHLEALPISTLWRLGARPHTGLP